MNSQESIERNVRMLIGDLQVQLLIAHGRISELEQELALATDKSAGRDTPLPESARKLNGLIDTTSA